MRSERVAVHAVPIWIGGEAEGAVGGLAAAAATEKTACVAGDLVAGDRNVLEDALLHSVVIGIFIMTMLPFFLPTYGEATTLSGLLAITTSAVIVWRMRSYVTWKRLWPILLTFIVVSTIAIFALTRIEDHILKRILGVALIVISIYFALFSQRIKLPTTNGVQVGAGTLSGLMGGFFGMQGPPAVLYFIQSEPSKEHYMAMTQTYFLIGNVMMTFVRAYNGFFTTTVLTDYCFGLGGVVIGTTLGAYVFKRISNRIFRYIVYAYIAISGVIILMTN